MALNFPPRDKQLIFFDQLNLNYRAVAPTDQSGPIDQKGLFVNAEGIAVWFPEWLRHVVDEGYTFEDATKVVFAQIADVRDPTHAPHPRPAPPPPPPPPPVPVPVPGPGPSPDDVPGVRDDMERFVAFYGRRVSATGFKPDETTTRDQRVVFLQSVVLAYADPTIKMKRADPNRPISDEAVVFRRPDPDYRRFWDFIIQGGASNWRLQVNGPGEILERAQPLVDPATLQIIPG